MSESTRGTGRKTAPAHNLPGPRPPDRRGVLSSGRIATLLIGQGHGFIRLANGRDVFFHRSDVGAGTSFNELAVGDSVTFELLDDAVSGPRAQHVQPRR